MRKVSFLFLLISATVFLSCQTEEYELNENSSKKYSFIKNSDNNEIYSKISVEILNLIITDLEKTDQFEKLHSLKKTYDINTGELTNEAKSSHQFIIETETKNIQTSKSTSLGDVQYRVRMVGAGSWDGYKTLPGFTPPWTTYTADYAGKPSILGTSVIGLNISNPQITYRAYIEGSGWITRIGSYHSGDEIPLYGFAGPGFIRAVRLTIPYQHPPYASFCYYRVYQGSSWSSWQASDGVAGNPNNSQAIKAFQMMRISV